MWREYLNTLDAWGTNGKTQMVYHMKTTMENQDAKSVVL
jgi:hypothetical protein